MFALALISALLHPGLAIDPALAARYFQEAEWASNDDGGNLWGKKLYGPTLFVDPRTGDAVANQPDKEGNLSANGTVFSGKVPNSFAAANTAKEWAGVNWSVIMWPLPEATITRTRLIMHESWHRIQAEIGLPTGPSKNDHLDSNLGRIWMLMEYRALSKALPAWGPERKQALQDALTFRAYRRSLFADSATNEDRMEVHEGMAEYTGIYCSSQSNSEARYFMAGRLKLSALKPSLTYAFAYETGPAYGLMLDQYSKTWRKELTTSSSLSAMLAKLAQIEMQKVDSKTALTKAKPYDGDALIKSETEREQKRITQEAEYRKTLIDGPRLHLSSTGNFTFDPNAVFPIKGVGNVYNGSKLTEEWGVLIVDGPVLIGATYQDAWVPAPSEGNLTRGTTWRLDLAPGWKIVPGKRKGDYDVVKG